VDATYRGFRDQDDVIVLGILPTHVLFHCSQDQGHWAALLSRFEKQQHQESSLLIRGARHEFFNSFLCGDNGQIGFNGVARIFWVVVGFVSQLQKIPGYPRHFGNRAKTTRRSGWQIIWLRPAKMVGHPSQLLVFHASIYQGVVVSISLVGANDRVGRGRQEEMEQSVIGSGNGPSQVSLRCLGR
jgi:hypothetical protein